MENQKQPQSPTRFTDRTQQLKAIIRDIKEHVNPNEINAMRRIFRSAVPLSYRSYVAAYFLMYGTLESRNLPTESGTFKKLFINAGRIHRLSASYLKKVICEVASLDNTNVGRISIFRTYTFVEIEESKANKVIKSVSGHRTAKGKQLQVSVAKKSDAKS